jgi:RHS repeat-associated protein
MKRVICIPNRVRSRVLIGVFIALFATAALVLLSASAQGPGSGSGSTVSQVSLPKALGEPRSVRVAPALGAVSDSISLEVPPGRRNVEPHLTLIYSSMGGLGDVGLGWSIETGRVERWRGDGTPTVGDPDAFSYALAGAGGELRNIGNGVYRARLESLYREFRRVGDGWEMYNGEGVLHRFGGTPASRIDGQLWLLDLVQDPSGNTITYSYERVGEALYPKEIRYTGYAPTGDLGANRVEFEYEERPDVRLSYGYGVREERTRRLQRISIFAGQSLVRRYKFEYYEYGEGSFNRHSLLRRIALVGADDSSRITLQTLEYGTRPLGWNGGTVVDNIPLPLADSEGRETGTRVLDVNGDGFADVVGNGQDVHLGDGQGHFVWNDSWSTSLATANVQFVQPDGDYQGGDKGVRLVDVNTDGLSDLFIASPFWGGRTEIWLNTGHGWFLDQQWTTSLQALDDEELGFGMENCDPNFDDCSMPYCTDYPTLPDCTPAPCQGTPDDPDDCSPPVCQGTPDDPDDCIPPICQLPIYDPVPVIESLTLVDEDYDSKGVQLTDVNGDGRLDILWSMSRKQLYFWRRCPVVIRAVFLNNGDGWEKNDLLTSQLNTIGDFVSDSEIEGYDVMDVNGDGLADIVRTFEGAQEVRLGTGSGWTDTDNSYSDSLVENDIISLNGDREGQGLMPVDFNDDGLVDFLIAKEGSSARAYQNTGTDWEEAPAMAAILDSLGIAFNTSDGKATGVTFADVDGDGLIDLLKATDSQQTTQAENVTGNSLSDLPAGDQPTDQTDMTRIYLPLVTATDQQQDNQSEENDEATNDENQLWLSASLRAGLLTKTTSALGEVTELAWASSTSFDNQRDDGVQGLPGPMPVVTKLTRHDGRGNVYQTIYDYRGGLFEDRQFRGFAWSQQLLPSGFRVETWYHQEEGLAGQLKVEEGYDAQGLVRTRQSSVYEIVSATSLVRQVRLVQSDVEAIDPGGTRHSRTMNTHDERLNIVQVWRDPDVEIDGDETTTLFSWARNDAAGIWSLSARIEVRGPDDALLSESIILYDGLPEGQGGRGLPSEARDLVEPGTYVAKFMAYDQYGNVVRLRDRNGNDTTFEYGDPTATFRTRAVDPEGRELRSEYDLRFGELVRDVDAGGNVTRKEYDAFGRLVKVVLPGDEGSPFGTQTYTYSPLGDAQAQYYHIAETETAGQPDTLETTSFFDGLGLIYRVEQEGAGGRTVVMLTEFDDAGNAVATSRPFFEGDPPSMSLIERDELHRPVRVVEPDGIALTLSYAGARVDVVDRRDSQTSFYRNADGQVTEIHQWVDDVEQVTHYRYDALGRLTTIVDALGEETRIAYDALGRRVRLEDPNAGTFQYRYDGEGRLVAQTGPDAQITRFHYNRAGDLLRKEFPDGTVNEFTYDTAGNLVRINDMAGVVDIRYDARGNVIERRHTVLGSTYVTGYAYDSLGRIRRITYPDGFTVNHEYDAGGNLARLTDGQGRVIAEGADYNAAGQLLELGFGNGDRSSFAYDELLRMTSIRALTGEGETLQSLDYAYDPGGNILSITDSAFGASQALEYDAIGRLTRAVGAYGEELYEYDAIGNLLRKGSLVFAVDPDHPQRVICGVDLASGHGNAGGIGNNPHANPCDDLPQGDNQQPGRNENRTGGPENNPNIARSFQLAYDELGNVIEKGGMRYEYDAENQLVRVRDAKGKVLAENVYDAGGQRVIQRTPQGTTIFIDGIYEEGKTHVSRHVWAGPLLVATVMTPRATVQLIGEVPDNALAGLTGFALTLGLVSIGLGTRRKWYAGLIDISRAWPRLTWKVAFMLLLILAILSANYPSALAANASPAQPRSEKRYYYHSNHLGSTNVVTDDRGKVVERRDYKPYGDRFDWTGPNSGPRELLRTFNGQRYDDVTGLYYFGARHYDPELGRFLTADTQVPDPMNPKSLHRYAFAGGNPIRYHDPTGHDWFLDILTGIFVALLIWAGVFYTIVTFGAGMPLLLGMILAGAFLVAGAFGAWAMARGYNVMDQNFWLSVAAGAVLGAAVGAGLAALPTMLFGAGAVAGTGLGIFGAAATTTFGAALQGAVIGALVGGMFGAIAATAAHFKSGGGPEGLLEPLVTGIAFGAATGALMGGVIGGVAKAMGWGALKAFLALKAAPLLANIGKVVFAATYGMTLTKAMALAIPFLGLFISSPPKAVGVPAWAFAGTWPGVRGDPGTSEVAALLQTMPLAP